MRLSLLTQWFSRRGLIIDLLYSENVQHHLFTRPFRLVLPLLAEKPGLQVSRRTRDPDPVVTDAPMPKALGRWHSARCSARRCSLQEVVGCLGGMDSTPGSSTAHEAHGPACD